MDGAISISAVQWLCNADKSRNDPRKRLKRFFDSLYACLSRGARAVLQVYPENPAQAEMLVAAAMKAGFSGGLVVDFPHSTRAKKYFLVLMVGQPAAGVASLPAARGLDPNEADYEQAGAVAVAERGDRGGKRHKSGGGRDGTGVAKGSKGWVLKKKAQMRSRGYDNIPRDTQYTGRKRRHIT